MAGAPQAMYIRNREEALDALSVVLALEERREQIIQITVKVALCLDADARRFLAGCQAGLIEGGLEYMRKKRRELLENQAAASDEPIVLIDSSADQLLEAVGMSLDALRLSDIIAEVFPEVGKQYERWEIARAVVGEEATLQEAVKTALRERNTDGSRVPAEMQAQVVEKIKAQRPPWMDAKDALKGAVSESLTTKMNGPGSDDPDLLFNVIAVHEDSARTILELLAGNPAEARVYINEMRLRIDQLLQLEERSDAA